MAISKLIDETILTKNLQDAKDSIGKTASQKNPQQKYYHSISRNKFIALPGICVISAYKFFEKLIYRNISILGRTCSLGNSFCYYSIKTSLKNIIDNKSIVLSKKRPSAKKCFYFSREKNFGDLLNKTLFDNLFENWKKCSAKKAEYIAIGSILENLILKEKFLKKIKAFLKNLISKNKIYLLGTGFIKEPIKEKERYYSSIIPIGVRGKTTKERLEKNGIDCSKTVLGDWGLIVDKLIKMPNIKKKYEVGIIPHFVDKNDPFIKEISKQKSIKIIDIQRGPEEFIKDLVECETVLSSALHPLITSDSYGIPNLAMRISDKVVGGDYKFNDYYSVFDLKVRFLMPSDINKIKDLKSYIKAKYRVDEDKLKIIKDNIWKAFQEIK